VHAILDEAYVCHVAFLTPDGNPICIPNGFVRDGESIIMHGKSNSFLQRYLCSGKPVCVEVTLMDGLVLARSAFHHSVNYRSVCVFGTPEAITEEKEKNRALELFSEKMIPGRWSYIRLPTSAELKGTSVCRLTLSEVSAKVRVGGPKDDDDDYKLDIWAGVIPTHLVSGIPKADINHGKKGKQPAKSVLSAQSNEISIPRHVTNFKKIPNPRLVPDLGLAPENNRTQMIIAVLVAIIGILLFRIIVGFKAASDRSNTWLP
jgi:nitroimidazol reductase NimA-like FMN-containing flavoprotein (pyridoxamine 5'-phosphate oxidase superfamily)